ncbi:hypothetical protein F8M41_024581 [Gigaspora margarita]|uniref:Uncharacterized protein n=1 Tax=Gigaspora margarita TaxID=4874 RepID=A0A8H3XK25_GIGMA|nr:hypothetical protein F8M41_024581 [Gigaspora margarita]
MCFVMECEPRILSTKYYEFHCDTSVKNVHDYFKKHKAVTWCIQNYVKYILETEAELDFYQAFNLFTDSLNLLKQLISTPVSVRIFCTDYLAWLESEAGSAIINLCNNVFSTEKMHKQSVVLHNTVEETVCLDAKTNAFQAHLWSGSPLSVETSKTPRTSQLTSRALTSLLNTPDKRPFEKEEFQQYIQKISIVCAFDRTIEDLTKEIGEELAKEVLAIRDNNPDAWTTSLEHYIDTVVEGDNETFKNKAQVKPSNVGEELFKLYCEKIFIDFFHLVDIIPLVSRKISERKHIVYQISSLFKFYERTFSSIEFDWIESHVHNAKIMKSAINSGIVKVDIKGTRVSDGLVIFHMEVAGPPCNATDKHIMGDTIKTMRTDNLNLIAILRNHLDCGISLATKIRVYSIQSINARLTLYALSMLSDGRFLANELATAVIPFSFLVAEVNTKVSLE